MAAESATETLLLWHHREPSGGFVMSRELRTAALLAVGYAAVAGAYIAISSSMASTAALGDLEEMRRLEIFKGFTFVTVTALLLFGGVWFLLRREARHRSELSAAHQALIGADRRASAGMLAASVAHDLNNAFTLLSLCLEELEGADEEVVAEMKGALAQASKLSTRLMRAGRHSATGSPERTELVGLTRDAIELVSLHRSVRRCTVDLECDDEVDVEAYPLLVHQMLTNLILNACEATGHGGRVLVRVERGSRGGAILEVQDDGPGLSAEARARLFEPFFTTKEHGTGLGLLSVRLCAELHDGHVDVRESPRGGAWFRIGLGHPLETMAPPSA